MILDLIGFTDAATARGLAPDGRLDGRRLAVVAYDGLAALLLAPPAAGVLGLLSGAARRRADGLVAWQRALEAAGAGPLLPARPGTRLGEDDALALLLRNGAEIRAALAVSGRRRQWQVTAAWTGQTAFAALARSHAAPLAAAAAAGRDALAAAVRDLMETERRRLAALGLDGLRAAAAEVAALPLDGPDTVLAAVVLLEPDGLPAFDAALERLDAALPAGSTVRAAGPLPAVSFAAVTVERPDPDRVDAARRRLGLSAGADRGAIRSAFRDRARATHPDAGGAGFEGLAEARDLLMRLPQDGGLILTIGRDHALGEAAA